MNLLQDNVRKLYFKYFGAAFGSAMVSSIYGLVDTAVVGQSLGPNGTAALAVVAPLWNLIYSLGLLTGIGGSVLLSMAKGKKNAGDRKANAYFTSAVIGSLVLAVLAWGMVYFLETPLLQLFGADDTLLALARRYLIPVKVVFPLFLLNQMLAAFLRNDNDPGLATAAVIGGGVFNMFGDIWFVFGLNMGIVGAGLATAIGAVISFGVMLVHFVKKTNTLRLVPVYHFWTMLQKITVTGFSTFFIDVAMGILTMLFNTQIMKYLGSDALAVYGPIVNISTMVQCCAYATGQAAQPILSTNYGAGKPERIVETLKYALYTSAVFAIFWTALSLIDPDLYLYVFMKPTEQILEIGPAIIRTYALSFLLLPLNVFSTYYFQALMQPQTAFIVSVFRGMLISGALILVLPIIAGPDSIWLAMPITELIIGIYVISKMYTSTRSISALKQA